MKFSKEFAVGLLTIVAFVLLYFGFNFLKGQDFFSTRSTYYAFYDNIDGLKASNEIYGRSPAMTALPDVKMLNEMSKTTIKAAQKQVDPPLLVPDDGFLLPVRTVPGGLNFYRSGTRDRIEPLNIGDLSKPSLSKS